MKINLFPWRKKPDEMEEALKSVLQGRNSSGCSTMTTPIPSGVFAGNLSNVTSMNSFFSSCSTVISRNVAKEKREAREAKLRSIFTDEDLKNFKKHIGTQDMGSY